MGIQLSLQFQRREFVSGSHYLEHRIVQSSLSETRSDDWQFSLAVNTPTRVGRSRERSILSTTRVARRMRLSTEGFESAPSLCTFESPASRQFFVTFGQAAGAPNVVVATAFGYRMTSGLRWLLTPGLRDKHESDRQLRGRLTPMTSP